LLERGAEPYDKQVLYNLHIHGGFLWFLKLIHAQAMKLGRQKDWEDPNWPMLDMGGYGCGARYLLRFALEKENMELAEWLLAHGANANAPPPPGKRSRRPPQTTLYEEAIAAGNTRMAELLLRFGATPSASALEGEQAFVAACMALDREKAQLLLAEHPEYLASPAAMFAAARHDRAHVAALLCDLGTSPDAKDAQGQTALHVAAYHDAARVASLLIERGADVDPVDSMYEGTPFWWAMWDQRQQTMDLLRRRSRDVWCLSFLGEVEHLRELITAEPRLARLTGSESTPLMWLPGDEQQALEIVKLFLAYGADPSIRNKQGLTAADLARKRGLDRAAELLERTPSAPA
jgi:ankyrin repeat protein